MYFHYFIIISTWNLEKDYIPIPQGWFLPSLVEIITVFWRRRFLNFVNLFLLFRNYFPLEQDAALQLDKIESPSPKDALCQVWLKLAPWFRRRKTFKILSMYFCCFVIISHWIRTGPSIESHESHSSNDVYTKFCWNWHSGSGVKF